jgi:DNA modification methylase
LAERRSGMKVLNQSQGKDWTLYHGDSCDVIKGLPDNSIHFSVYSPPFASLYTYSNSDRDMGNSRNGQEFMEHFQFLAVNCLGY